MKKYHFLVLASLLAGTLSAMEPKDAATLQGLLKENLENQQQAQELIESVMSSIPDEREAITVTMHQRDLARWQRNLASLKKTESSLLLRLKRLTDQSKS